LRDRHPQVYRAPMYDFGSLRRKMRASLALTLGRGPLAALFELMRKDDEKEEPPPPDPVERAYEDMRRERPDMIRGP